MKHLLFILLFVLAIGPVSAQVTDNNETTTLYFIRHAEKDRSNPDNKDPHLSEVGVLRALKWSYVFEKAPIDAVYSTAYHRTIETATPTANTKNVDITTYDPRAMDITAFLNDNRGKTVLIVGHSNTTPVLVNQIIKQDKYPQIKDNNNANLYIVQVLPNGSCTDQLLVIE